MSIEIKIHGETAVDVVKQLAGLTEGFLRSTGAIEQAVTGTTGQADTAAPRGRRGKKGAEADSDRPQISTNPEDRKGPEDSVETQGQDAADEKADSDAGKVDNPKLTHDDVRTALGKYVKAYGMSAAQEDGPKVIALALGKTHDDAKPMKISDIPDDQEALGKVVSGVDEMTAKNPFKRQPDL